MHSIIKILFLLLVGFFANQTVFSQKKINVEHADSLSFDEKVYGKDVRLLIGNVRFKHENAKMFCDTAYLYSNENRITCTGSIHIIQNDTLQLYGDRLFYNGNTKLAQVRDNVKLIKKDVVLTTDYLDYDRANNIAYYFNNGKIVNEENTLTSKTGYYYPDTETAFFKDSVEGKNKKFTIYSDTLIYHTVTKISNIEGPTFIISDENTIYSEKGYYDMMKDEALLKQNAYVEGEQLLKGDTIYYNRKTGIGEVFNHMELHDTTNNMIITGNYGFYNELTKEALTTQEAVLMQIYEIDTLYLHADTLEAVPIEEGEEKLIKAYRKVQYYRKDLQGRCDSMVFDSRDTTNTFYYDPVMWSLENQLTADKIIMYTKNEVLDRVYLDNRAFIISEQDTGMYNQIKGKNMTGFIKDNRIYKVHVDGNAQSIYFPEDDTGTLGVNKAECSSMVIFLKDNAVNKIKMLNTPTGTMTPLPLITMEELKMEGFHWLDMFRPRHKSDIFHWKELPVIDRGEDRNEYNLDDTYFEEE